MKDRTGADIYAMLEDISTLLTPPPKETVSESISKLLYVKAKGNRWVPLNMDLVPYMRLPTDLVNSRKYTRIIFMGPARTGKSQALVLGSIAYAIAVGYWDTLLLHLTEDKAQEWSKKELIPAINNSPKLLACKTDNVNDFNILDMTFRASNVVLVRWPSKNHLASTTVQLVLITDYERWESNIGGEGSGSDLAFKRITTYGRAGMAIVESSPGHRVVDIDQELKPHDSYECVGIASLYNTGDKHCYYLKCLNPTCREWFWGEPSTIWWDDSLPSLEEKAKSARCKCPHCGYKHNNTDLHKILIPNGQWLKQGEWLDKDDVKHGEGVDSITASFWLRAPVCAFYSLEDIVRDWLKAKRVFEMTGDEGPLQAFTNTTLGDPYIEQSRLLKVDSSALKDNISFTYILGEVPSSVTALIAAVDVQGGDHGRFEVAIWGFNRLGNIYLVDRYSIRSIDNRPIKPDQKPSDWDVLISDVLGYKAYSPEFNKALGVFAVVIDSGGLNHTTKNAYDFIKRWEKHFNSTKQIVRLVKGVSTKSQKTTSNSTENRGLILVQTDYFKDILYNKFAIDRSESGAFILPKDVPNKVLRELTSEIQTNKNGRTHWEKVSDKARNETWDLGVYMLALLNHMGFNKMFTSDKDFSNRDWFKPLTYNPYASELSEEVFKKFRQFENLRLTRSQEEKQEVEAKATKRKNYLKKLNNV